MLAKVKVTQSCPIHCTPVEFSRPEYWSGQPFPSPGDRPNPGIKPRCPILQVDSLPAEPPGKPNNIEVGNLSLLQWIFLAQESNQGLLNCRQILYQLSYQGSLTWQQITKTNKSQAGFPPHTHTHQPCGPSSTPLAFLVEEWLTQPWYLSNRKGRHQMTKPDIQSLPQGPGREAQLKGNTCAPYFKVYGLIISCYIFASQPPSRLGLSPLRLALPSQPRQVTCRSPDRPTSHPHLSTATAGNWERKDLDPPSCKATISFPQGLSSRPRGLRAED